MIRKEFPDLQWLKKQAEDGFANRQVLGGLTLPAHGWPTVILNVKSKNVFRDNIRGPLSIFTNISGSSAVQCRNKKTTIHKDFFFVTNHDQRYTLEINEKAPAETFNIHLGEYWADQALRTIVSRPEQLIDEAFFTIPFQRLELYNKLYHKDIVVNTLIGDLKNSDGDTLKEEENLYDLLAHLLRQDTQIRKSEKKIPALKNATRQEITKRLLIATDYIYTFYNGDISLDELAAVACLSKFHFLRLFKIAFGKTPHKFINEVKVEQSKSLLKNPKMEVQAIARALGFQDASTFSRMFYNQTGFYPSQYR